MKFLSKIKWPFVALILLIIGYGTFHYYRPKLDQLPANVRTSMVSRQKFTQKVTVAGQVYPKRRSIITAPFDGYVQKLYVKIGDTVKKGAPIVSMAESLAIKELSYPIRSPFEGKVSHIAQYEGEFVPRGSKDQYIAFIDDLSSFVIKIEIPEIDLLKVKEGQNVIIKFSAVQNKNYQGVVEKISLSPATSGENWRNNSANYPCNIRIVNPDKNIKVGMSAVLDIITYEKDNILTLPHEFVQKIDDQYYVYDTQDKKKEVEIGVQNEWVFEITEGLKEGDVVKQVDFFHEGPI